MRIAQILEAASILYKTGLPHNTVVSFMTLGSEGALLKIGERRVMIDFDGTPYKDSERGDS